MQPCYSLLTILLLVFTVQATRVMNLAIYAPLTDFVQVNNSTERTPFEVGRYIPNVASAIRAIQDVNQRDTRIVPELEKYLSDCDVEYKFHILDSITSFGTAIQQVIPSLILLFNSPIVLPSYSQPGTIRSTC